ncbi:betaine/proline/choline family ABC transporter ATP-binding protein [Ensifer sp. BR816]|uniref:quaternary amine ABC transporter ATP-binding protein n=1 Tax=Rhizobium sp. (strain BR816) TaxID=1057002 RepID=UPI00036C4179
MEAHSIEFKDVWKVFGSNRRYDLTCIQDGRVSKADLLERYGCVVAVAGVSFKVEPGEIFCVMGLSGSGKSTLVRHVNRLIDPTAGQIVIGGENISKKSENEMRELRAKSIGMVFQNMALLPHRTVRDNVALSLELRNIPAKQRHDIAEEKLALVHLSGWGDRYPDELSGGMKQRVGLARAMAADPAILLMDEPFSALDPLIRRELQDQFRELSMKLRKTTVFITHDLDEAVRLGHRIGVMKDGKMLQIGSPDEIITKPRDPYVEKFVEGSSRLKLLTAESVMAPLAEYSLTAPANELVGARRLALDANLKELATVLNQSSNGPVVVSDREGKDVGVVTTAFLLRGIEERA